jgi:hypothetical protein
MTHVRQQIRNQFKTVLDAQLSSDYVTYSSRKSAVNHDPSKVLIDMRFLNDQTRQRETMQGGNNARVHVASLYIRIQRSAAEDQIDDLLDADEVAVVNAIDTHDWSSLLEEEPELIQVNFTDDPSGGYVLGAAVLRFDVEYRINRNDPETVII